MSERNLGLQLRMGIVMLLLAVTAIGFAGALGFIFNSFIVAIVIVTIFAVLQYALGGRIALKSVGAKKVSSDEYPHLHETISRVAQQAGIPEPDVAVAQSNVENAFAAGRTQDSAVVCVTTGLMKTLNEDELEGVIAHEVSHIRNRDVIVMTVAGVLTMVTGMILRYAFYMNIFSTRDARGAGALLAMIAVSAITYIIGFVLIRALSRYREHAADKGAAELTGNPTALAQALRKIDQSMDETPSEDLRDVQGASALMISPVKSRITALFSTHPSTEKRIERLNDMSTEL